MKLTHRIETDQATGLPVVWIDQDGQPIIRQPHHPNAVLDPSDPAVGAWESDAVAEAWAAEYIAGLEAEQAAAVAAQSAAEEDRARLVNIEAMLKQLLAKK